MALNVMVVSVHYLLRRSSDSGIPTKTVTGMQAYTGHATVNHRGLRLEAMSRMIESKFIQPAAKSPVPASPNSSDLNDYQGDAAKISPRYYGWLLIVVIVPSRTDSDSFFF